jgi:uncharacterized protein (TIGR02145 family)
MLSPRLTNCPECANIPSLLRKIDCKLAELGNNLYNNISYMLNKPIPSADIIQLMGYRRILQYKYINPNYAHRYTINMISSRVIRLTVGCVSRCNTPEPCKEVPCNVTIVPNPTTTTTTTFTPIVPTTTTTSTTITCINCIEHDVTIGTQIWTGCNLNVTTYRNGDTIPQITDPNLWKSTRQGAWCYYNNDPANGAIYGKLYNWYAVNDPRGLAPAGYHMPTAAEWNTLINYLGGFTIAGEKLKESGICHWNSPNEFSNNQSLFTAYAAGIRSSDPIGDGGFYDIGERTLFWTSTEKVFGTDPDSAYIVSLYNFSTYASEIWTPQIGGLSVRLIKDSGSTTTTTTSHSSTSTTSTSSSTTTSTTTINNTTIIQKLTGLKIETIYIYSQSDLSKLPSNYNHPCPFQISAHTCDRGFFEVTGNNVYIGDSLMNNLNAGGPGVETQSGKFTCVDYHNFPAALTGGTWTGQTPLTGGSRYSEMTISGQQAADIANAYPGHCNIEFKLVPTMITYDVACDVDVLPHENVTWTRISKPDGTVIYNDCPIGNIATVNICI